MSVIMRFQVFNLESVLNFSYYFIKNQNELILVVEVVVVLKYRVFLRPLII